MPEPFVTPLIISAAVGLAQSQVGRKAGELIGDTVLGKVGDVTCEAFLRAIRSNIEGRKRGLPANHDAERAVRTSQLKALRVVVQQFQREALAGNRTSDLKYASSACRWLDDRLAEVDKLKPGDDAETMVAAINASLADAPTARQASARKSAEDSTWAEFSAAVSDPPDRVRALFLVGDETRPCWFEAFGYFVGDQVKTNEAFRSILTSSQLANQDAILADILEHLKDIGAKIAASSAPRPDLLRRGPFEVIDEYFALFRTEGHRSPVPSRAEFLRGEVPAFALAETITERLAAFGWAYVQGAASAGKTTLALRLATGRDASAGPAFYLDLGDGHQDYSRPADAITSLATADAFLILDNVHRDPRLANVLWDRWRAARGAGSRLILLATLSQGDITAPPQETLDRLSRQAENPPLLLRPDAAALGAIARYLYTRDTGKADLDIPDEILTQWRNEFGGQLHAFGFAILESMPSLRMGNLQHLYMNHALRWVRRNWLDRLDERELANVECLAAFAAQDLELTVPAGALPHPDATDALQNLGLCAATTGQLETLRRFRLIEPGWGSLLFAARTPPPDATRILVAAATRRLSLALILSRRLRTAGQTERHAQLWEALTAIPPGAGESTSDLNAGVFKELLIEAEDSGHPEMVGRLLAEAARAPRTFAANVCTPPISFLASLLNFARQRGFDVGDLWAAVEAEPAFMRLGLRASPLEHVASFLKAAKMQGRDIAVYWDAFDADRPMLMAKLLAEPLGHVATIIELAKVHGRDSEALWRILEADRGALDARLGAEMLTDIARFIDTAERHGRDVAPLWSAIGADWEALADKALAAPLDAIGSLSRQARRDGIDLAPFWVSLAGRARELSDRMKTAGFTSLAGFFREAPDELVALAFADWTGQEWAGVEHGGDMSAAVWVAIKCQRTGREDLADQLTQALLKRAARSDYPPTQGATFYLAIWTITNASAESRDLVPRFIATVCTPGWLNKVYARSHANALSKGLLLLSQTMSRSACGRFHTPSLRERVHRELARLPDVAADARDKAGAVRLLGAACLSGMAFGGDVRSFLDPRQIADLPASALPHRAVSLLVEPHQFELWIGLRAAASINGQPLPVSREVMEETLRLLKANLEESAANPDSVLHKVNLNLEAWLRNGLKHPTPVLQPGGGHLSRLLPP